MYFFFILLLLFNMTLILKYTSAIFVIFVLEYLCERMEREAESEKSHVSFQGEMYDHGQMNKIFMKAYVFMWYKSR